MERKRAVPNEGPSLQGQASRCPSVKSRGLVSAESCLFLVCLSFPYGQAVSLLSLWSSCFTPFPMVKVFFLHFQCFTRFTHLIQLSCMVFWEDLFLPIRLFWPINQHSLGTPRLWMTKQQGPSINRSGQANSQQGTVDLMGQTD